MAIYYQKKSIEELRNIYKDNHEIMLGFAKESLEKYKDSDRDDEIQRTKDLIKKLDKPINFPESREGLIKKIKVGDACIKFMGSINKMREMFEKCPEASE
ncbi:MAG: hypothetical protein PHH54_07175 [Candidatus Nanoarchaeia archaeon]|nr:hypothetical protein [Candidatus Nanoarchaeia archaeon]MDD5741737.1 hypothetical protein [Candidatus Nanoarchaeia archaeon]